MRAAQLGINLTKLEVSVGGAGDYRGILGLDEDISAGMSELRTNIKISADNATHEQLQALAKWGEMHAPVGCTIRDSPANILHVEIL